MPYPNPNLPVRLANGEHVHIRESVGYYDFAVDGGAAGTINLRGDSIPAGASILAYKIGVDTALTSGGSATAALGVAANGDILTATAFGSAPWSTTGTKAEVRGQALSQVTAAPIKFTIATAALTGGAFRVRVEWVLAAA